MGATASTGRIASRHRRLLATLTASALVIGACSSPGGSPSGDPSTGPSPSVRVTTAPPTLVPATPAATTSPPEPTATADPAEARWEDAGALHWARSEPSALLLGDGRVLVVGDVGGKYEPAPEHSRNAELWDPATGAWSQTEPLVKARASFAAVTLVDGRALVAGGINDRWQSYSSAYVFDPGPETWTKTGLMQAARANPAVAVLADGRVLVAGGMYWAGYNSHQQGGVVLAAYDVRLADTGPDADGYALATAEIFDPATMEWSETGSMRFARWSASAVTLGDGRVLVWGADERAEIYDPDTGRFTPTDAWPAVEGSAFERLGIPPELWPTEGDRSINSGGTLVALPDGDALLVNADTSWELPDEHFGFMTVTLRFDTAGGQWTLVGEPSVRTCKWYSGECDRWGPEHAGGGAIIALRDGRVLLAGGVPPGADRGASAAELLDPASGTWAPLRELPDARAEAGSALLADGSVLVVGGYADGGDGSPVGLAGTFRLVLEP